MLPDENQAKLLKCLQDSPKGKEYIRPAILDTDGPWLPKKLEEIFKKADFAVTDWPDGPAMSWSRAGIFLVVHQLTNVPPHITAVQRCLFSVGIEARGDVDPKHPRTCFNWDLLPGCGGEQSVARMSEVISCSSSFLVVPAYRCAHAGYMLSLVL